MSANARGGLKLRYEFCYKGCAADKASKSLVTLFTLMKICEKVREKPEKGCESKDGGAAQRLSVKKCQGGTSKSTRV